MKINAVKATLLLTASMLTVSVQAQEQQRVVRIYNWLEYLPPQILEDFEKETGIHPIYDVFDNPQMLESKLLTGNSGYDVVFPSSTTMKRYINAKAIQPLDKSKLPNLPHLDEKVMHSLEINDPGNQYAIPYMWGTTLIGYNREAIEKALGSDVDMDTWDILFKEENISKLKECGVGLLDSADEIMPIALNYLGLPSHSTKKEDYEQARDLMLKIRPYVKYFNSSRYGMDLANGNICLGVGWSGGMALANKIARASNNGVDVRMSLPREGVPFWSDVMVIAANAPDFDEAHAFINYMLRPDVIARASNEIGYPNANKDATELVIEPIRNDPHMYIPEEKQKLLFPLEDVAMKTGRMRTRAWNAVLSGESN